MKQIVGTLLVLIAGIVPSFAQTMLKISLTDRRPITVSVDGRHFRKSGESVTVNDLPRGRHYVIVYITETLSNGRTGEGIIWEGKVKTYQGQASLCTVDPHTREAAITEMDMNAVQSNLPTDPQGYNNYNLNNYDSRTDNSAQQPGNANNNDTYNNTLGNNSPDDNVAPTLPDGTPVASPVTIDEGEDAAAKKATKTTKKATTKTDKLKTKINVRTTDTEKMTAAKEVLKNESLTTGQVMSLMDCFGFESTKLEFAQWAYAKTTDKANFKQVKQKLAMKNYREEMDKFLKGK
ncbi:DUF4476 domain-containing protein [Flavipsychrobacter stenotrophus]|nr:DUF4476 domain-containing protein [Flavipsychrobacter stenotrophus]